LVFGFSEIGVLAAGKEMKPGETLPPPETLKKAGAAEQMRNIKELRKKCRSRPGADPEQSRSGSGWGFQSSRCASPKRDGKVVHLPASFM
jgi:hypothetical protein